MDEIYTEVFREKESFIKNVLGLDFKRKARSKQVIPPTDTWVEDGVIHKKLYWDLTLLDFTDEIHTDFSLTGNPSPLMIVDARKGIRFSIKRKKAAYNLYRDYRAIAIVTKSPLAWFYNYFLRKSDIQNVRFFKTFRKGLGWIDSRRND